MKLCVGLGRCWLPITELVWVAVSRQRLTWHPFFTGGFVFKLYVKLLNDLDSLMLALTKQKYLGLDAEVMIALKNLTKSRNTFKRQLIKETAKPILARNGTVFTYLLDQVTDNTSIK